MKVCKRFDIIEMIKEYLYERKNLIEDNDDEIKEHFDPLTQISFYTQAYYIYTSI